jgi:hypothetical protein
MRASKGVPTIQSDMMIPNTESKKRYVFVLLLSKESLMSTLKLVVTLELRIPKSLKVRKATGGSDSNSISELALSQDYCSFFVAG